jgi:2-polyprenyl-6-methoxyphenol hydroxylase-like FAD-dependent oxidoreductase
MARQKDFLRNAFAGMHRRVNGWLEHLDTTPAFYYDSITQLQLDSWSRGRVTLVGDAGYCPGLAVGGSTSLVVVGTYVLAGELARAGGATAQRSRLTNNRWVNRCGTAALARAVLPKPWFPLRGLRSGR